MPSGCVPIRTSFISITTSSAEGGIAKRIPPTHARRPAQYAEPVIGPASARPVGYCAYEAEDVFRTHAASAGLAPLECMRKTHP